MKQTETQAAPETTKIETGVYRHINKFNETWIIRGPNYFDAGQNWWAANEAKDLDSCNDNNSACINFNTKKELIKWLNA